MSRGCEKQRKKEGKQSKKKEKKKEIKVTREEASEIEGTIIYRDKSN